jgi:uncharacterized UPF0160 family protein
MTTKLMAVHSGSSHADEKFAVVSLRRIFNIKYVRTRDPRVIAQADIVADVGDVYDPTTMRFDHHQAGRPVRDNGIIYCSFGQIWLEYGAQICGGSQEVADRVDQHLVMPIDADDNGQALYKKTDFGINPLTVSEALFRFNPTWLEGPEVEDQNFERSLVVADEILERTIARQKAVVFSREPVREAIAQQGSDPLILVLTKPYAWFDTVINETSNTAYVVFPSDDGVWHVRCVPIDPALFEVRRPLPKEWGGLNGDALIAASKVPDAIYCHHKLFIAGARSLEGAKLLAQYAILS